MHENIRFLKGFLKDKDVASIIPTSPFGVKRICSFIDFSKPLTIVEYGPGTGPVTKGLLERMTSDSKLIAIEKNAAFAEHLREEIRDPRCEIVEGDAREVRTILRGMSIEKVDHIISGIPLSFLTPEDRSVLLRESATLLQPDGSLLIYQIREFLREELPKIFPAVRVIQESLNIPPLFIFEARLNRSRTSASRSP